MNNKGLASSLVLVVCAAIVRANHVDIPDFIHVCKRNDPDLGECIKKSVNEIKPKLATGLPQYDIPSLEPLIFKELTAGNEANGLKVTVKDIKCYGASDFEIEKIRTEIETLRFAVDLLLPHLYIEGQYEVNGRVLLLPIQGNGPIYGNFTDALGQVKIQAAVKTDEQGEEHMHLSELRLRIAIRKGTLRLENLFNGDPVLGNAVNNAINSNFDGFIKELQPLIEKALSENFLELGNKIIEPFPFHAIFPES
ncbi:hypothetical protein QAD02_004925 [Eretmocerus hayati]|uniref:Uncharacterized protein n=1 Tax=Eretmocerus hayati TaxID=131215 RepID=A0ACC2NS10_9HYME|nr:hypothetical protein QAD02_004925 [Eretmocerus hayati]